MRYRKKPLEVEAFHWVPMHGASVPDWLWDAMEAGTVDVEDAPGATCGVLIKTPEGTLRVAPGDWIIRGVEGELYPCKASVFEATYEPVI